MFSAIFVIRGTLKDILSKGKEILNGFWPYFDLG